MTQRVTKDDNGKTIDLIVDDSLVITLDENPSTGYAWKVTKAPDAQVLAKTTDAYVAATPAATGPPVVGQAGRHHWDYDAVGAGSTSIELQLFPPGQETKAAETFSILVDVAAKAG